MGSLDLRAVEEHSPILAIIGEGVFHWLPLGRMGEPLLRNLGRNQLA